MGEVYQQDRLACFVKITPNFPEPCRYVNYLGELDEEAVRIAYGNKYKRLAALKPTYDPTSFFRGNANIKPNPAASTAIAAASV